MEPYTKYPPLIILFKHSETKGGVGVEVQSSISYLTENRIWNMPQGKFTVLFGQGRLTRSLFEVGLVLELHYWQWRIDDEHIYT